jgi:hypothetical protein
VDDSPTPNGWLGLGEAAEQLGISLDAMRRRVRRGEYVRRQVRTRHGLAWQVRLDHPKLGATVGATVAPTVAPTVDGAATVGATLGDFVLYLRERDHLRDQELERAHRDALAKAEAAAMWQARAELLAVQLQQAQERILALEAPKEPVPAPGFTGEATDGLGAEPAQQSAERKRPWWRFW